MKNVIGLSEDFTMKIIKKKKIILCILLYIFSHKILIKYLFELTLILF